MDYLDREAVNNIALVIREAGQVTAAATQALARAQELGIDRLAKAIDRHSLAIESVATAIRQHS
jgi:hypothetical protein